MEDEEEQKAFSERSSLLVRNMDNPARLMAQEIRRLNEPQVGEPAKRRSQLEIFVDIIRAVSLTPLRPTHIMKNANISYNELKKILESLERKQLVAGESTVAGKFYQATNDGLRVLEDFKSMREKLFA